MKAIEMNRIKEVGRKTITDFVHSESGSVGVKKTAAIGAFAAALVLSQSTGEAVDGTVSIVGGTVTIAI